MRTAISNPHEFFQSYSFQSPLYVSLPLIFFCTAFVALFLPKDFFFSQSVEGHVLEFCSLATITSVAWAAILNRFNDFLNTESDFQDFLGILSQGVLLWALFSPLGLIHPAVSILVGMAALGWIHYGCFRSFQAHLPQLCLLSSMVLVGTFGIHQASRWTQQSQGMAELRKIPAVEKFAEAGTANQRHSIDAIEKDHIFESPPGGTLRDPATK